jgi:hypothetical protein
MQIFLPYPDFARSVHCLDPRRLGNQIYRECLTLIRGGWPNHPVARMWADYRPAIAAYALCGLAELSQRGYDYPHHRDTFEQYLSPEIVLPPFVGDDRLHSSHRAALLFKNREWYGRFGWTELPAIPDHKGRLPYYWPSNP